MMEVRVIVEVGDTDDTTYIHESQTTSVVPPTISLDGVHDLAVAALEELLAGIGARVRERIAHHEQLVRSAVEDE